MSSMGVIGRVTSVGSSSVRCLFRMACPLLSEGGFKTQPRHKATRLLFDDGPNLERAEAGLRTAQQQLEYLGVIDYPVRTDDDRVGDLVAFVVALEIEVLALKPGLCVLLRLVSSERPLLGGHIFLFPGGQGGRNLDHIFTDSGAELEVELQFVRVDGL